MNGADPHDRRLYTLGLRLNRALVGGLLTAAEAEGALVRAGYADPPEGCEVVEDGLDLTAWLAEIEFRAKLRAEGARLGVLLTEGLLEAEIVRTALRAIRGIDGGGGEIVEAVVSGIRDGKEAPETARAA